MRAPSPSATAQAHEDRLLPVLSFAEKFVVQLDRTCNQLFTMLELRLRVLRKSRLSTQQWSPDDRLRAMKAGELGEPLRSAVEGPP